MIFDVLGWIGMVLVLIAYGLLPENAWFSFALQVAWAIIAIVSIIKIIKNKK